MQNFSVEVRDHKKDVQRLKPDGSNAEEVACPYISIHAVPGTLAIPGTVEINPKGMPRVVVAKSSIVQDLTCLSCSLVRQNYRDQFVVGRCQQLRQG
jgi:hypothetical protein